MDWIIVIHKIKMDNNEFQNLIETVLKNQVGYYTGNNYQKLAFAFHNQPRDVEAVVGLEVVIQPSLSGRLFRGGTRILANSHAVSLYQYPGAKEDYIYLAEKRLAALSVDIGAEDYRCRWGDPDSSSMFNASLTSVFWLAECGCDYDPCGIDYESLYL